ncbi:glycosyltransferase, activator-dependent family [Sinosporangium album]|uniref:Glycosyltransferase, activator-dependent family n=1 Tax=Sinosporangium album TaxID=504805 RepID=A0A1G8GHS2_9ACTN|nr:activator-dependent family glycosyltransferase [Sinosporangium album]SDH93924.1 glycosyltransferase, activator-dependent family [Sinosporangium album]
MRVLIATYSEKTHFLGMVPLAWALRTAGHEVLVASQPELIDAIAGTGLTAVPVGRDHSLYRRFAWARLQGLDDDPGFFDVGDRWPDDLTWSRVRWGYREVVTWWWKVVNEPMLDDLADLCRAWRPDLVLWEPGTHAAPVAAAASGAAHGRVLWSADLYGRMRADFLRLAAEQPASEREDALGEWLAARISAYGGAFSEHMTRGHFTVDPMPRSIGLDSGVRRVPMRYVPYNGRAVVPDWLREPADRPRVCLTMGVSADERLGRHAVSVSDVLDALADLDVEIVAPLPHAPPGFTAPPNARVTGFVPLHALLPTCAAMINHGGPGTVCTTLFHGVPQLLLPRTLLDDPLVARNIAEQGAGLALPSAEATGTAVREHLLRLLDEPSFAEGAARLREEMLAMPGPNAVVPLLEELTATYHGSPPRPPITAPRPSSTAHRSTAPPLHRSTAPPLHGSTAHDETR